MALIRLRNPLAYPGGLPGINQSHPALIVGPSHSLNLPAFSGVAISGVGSFLRLDQAALPVGKGGTPTGTIDGDIGPSWTSPSIGGNYTEFAQGGPALASTNVTVGAIVKLTSFASVQIFTSCGLNGSNDYGIEVAATTGILTVAASNVGTASSIALSLNTPYFIAMSMNGAGSYVLIVVTNLRTGVIQTAKVTGVTSGSPLTGGAAIFVGNWLISPTIGLAGKLAALTYIAGFCTQEVLLQWAAAPWDFWYPSTPSMMFMPGRVSVTQHNQTVTVSGSSALTAVKQVAPIRGWTTTSAVSAIKRAGKAVAISSSSALTALTTKVKLVSVAISSSSAVSLVKQVGKTVAISASSAVSAVGSFITHISVHNQTVAIATSGALAVIKAVSITLGAPVFRITEDGNQRITEDGNIRIIEGPSGLTSASFVAAVGKTVGKVVPISTTATSASAVRITKGVAKLMAISATSALRMIKTVGKVLAIASSSAASLATIAGITTAQVIAIATSSAVAVIKQVDKIISIVTTTVDAISIVKAVAITKGGAVVTFISTSSVSVVKAVSKTLGWRTVSAVVARGIRATTVTITIACTSVVTIFPAIIRQVIVIIVTGSTVSLTTLLRMAGRATITLVGSATRVVLYGIKNVLSLIGQRPQLELTGMAREQDGTFHYGESWIINGIARDDSGALLDLTGATVQLRIVTVNPNAIVLDLATPANGSITNPANGLYSFTITPDQQIANAMTLNGYGYEARVTLSDGSIATLNTGEITVLSSKFVNFP